MVLGDSIPKYVQIKNVKVHGLKGHTVNGVIDRIRFKQLQVEEFDKILVHLGSNDLSNLITSGAINNTTVKQVLGRYKNLRACIRRRNKRCIILWSSILPRVAEFEVFLPYTLGLNFALEKWCAQSEGCNIFIPTYSVYLVEGKPNVDLFAQDGLHLNGAGVEKLEQCFQMAFSTQYLLDRVQSKRTLKLAKLSY